MLAGEMENMFAAPVGNGQWAGQQGDSRTLPAQLKAEQAAPEQEAAQSAREGPVDSGTANMSDQMLQILAQLKRGG